MSPDPTYTLWHPRLIIQNGYATSFHFNATPFAALNFPTGSQEFFDDILEAFAIPTTAKSWLIRPYRSGYHGEDTGDWRDRWTKNWHVRIGFSAVVSNLPVFEEEYYETYAFTGEPEHYTKDHDHLDCRIIADFQTREDRKAALNTLHALSDTKLPENLDQELETEDIDIGDVFYQLQICLPQQPESFFSSGAALAVRLEELCKNAGGIVSFDQRADEWDEL